MKFNSEHAKSMEELRVIVEQLEAYMAAPATGNAPIVGDGDHEENVARAKAAPQVLAAEVACHLVAHVETLAHGKRAAPYVAAALVAAAEVIREAHGATAEFDEACEATFDALVNRMTAMSFKLPEVENKEGGDE